MIEYVIGRLSPTVFTVAKFEDDDQPAAVYQLKISETDKRWTCDCPAFIYKGKGKTYCKHIKMLLEQLEFLATEGGPD